MEQQRLRVLIVEDREDDAYLVERQLRRSGYDPLCRRVQSAEEMRGALKDEVWDLVISDYLLPGFTALGALQVYHDAGLDIPFIVVSGSVADDVAVEAMKQGVHDYMTKDNLTRLTAAIDRELREAHTRRNAAETAGQSSRALLVLLSRIQTEAGKALEPRTEESAVRVAMGTVRDLAAQALEIVEKMR